MISFWEKESFLDYDAIVLGAGIIGLCTAISYLEKNKNHSLLVLERGVLPSGASTRNAGFACFGSATEILHDIKLNGLEQTLSVIEKRIVGLQKIRYMLGDSAICYENYGGYELIFNQQTISNSELDFVNEQLFHLFSNRIFKPRNDLVYKFGFDTVSTIIENKHEGQIHTGKLIRMLFQKAQSLGATILCGSEVISVEENSRSVIAKVFNKATNKDICFSANSMAFCGNAFSNNFFSTLDLKPARGQVIITKPIENLKFKGAFHFDEGFYYFRNVGDRVLLGGGRNLDFDTEATFSFEKNDKIIDRLIEILQQIILPNQQFEIDMTWQGIMGFSESKMPIVRRLTNKQICGFGCNGMGVAIGCLIGEEVAELMN